MFFVVLTDSSTQKKKKIIIVFNDSIKLYLLWLLLVNCEKNFLLLDYYYLKILYLLQLIKNDYIIYKKKQ